MAVENDELLMSNVEQKTMPKLAKQKLCPNLVFSIC